MSRAEGCVSMVSPLRVRCPEADPRATRRRLLGCPAEPQPSHPRGGTRGRAGIIPGRRRLVIDVREAIEEVRQRTGDQAYWHALEMVLGTLTARTLRSTLRLKIRGEDLSERERVAKGLAEIFSAQAATVDNLARREAALRGPRPREAALQELETHSHWVDFSDPANEARRAMGFVKRGIERGAKVVALLPSPDIEAALDSLARTLPLSLYCPMPDYFPGEPGLMAMFLSGHGWASILDTALGPPPS